MKNLEKIVEKIALPVIGLAAVVLIVTLISSSKDTSEENNAYVRVINCIVSYPANTRTINDIELCYTMVERDLNIEIQRYDSSKLN
jgi:hypothetical protein